MCQENGIFVYILFYFDIYSKLSHFPINRIKFILTVAEMVLAFDIYLKNIIKIKENPF